MARYFFPTTTDGVRRDDPVGSEHEKEGDAIKEGHTHAREMAEERLRQGDINFEEVVEIRNAAGHILGRRIVTVMTKDSLGS